MYKIVLVTLALAAFAANSVLCRMAMGAGHIDATSFTIIRLLSGALVLCLLLRLRNQEIRSAPDSNNWWPATMLFVYAAAFSFAYLKLDAGVGALILFGSVQITAILVGLFMGDRLNALKLFGLMLAFSGLAYLLFPNAPVAISAQGFFLMVLSGMAWGGYTVMGKASKQPLKDTASNFLRSLVFALLLTLVFLVDAPQFSSRGVLLAITSGAITSGLGYAIWYAVLPSLSYIQAGVLQLLVPVIATIGGVLLLGEVLSQQIVVSLLVVLLGILMVLYSPKLSTAK